MVYSLITEEKVILALLPRTYEKSPIGLHIVPIGVKTEPWIEKTEDKDYADAHNCEKSSVI